MILGLDGLPEKMNAAFVKTGITAINLHQISRQPSPINREQLLKK